MTKEQLAIAIVASKRKGNYSHSPGKRIVGWIVDEEIAGLSDALFALDVIEGIFVANPPQLPK